MLHLIRPCFSFPRGYDDGLRLDENVQMDIALGPNVGHIGGGGPNFNLMDELLGDTPHLGSQPVRMKNSRFLYFITS